MFARFFSKYSQPLLIGASVVLQAGIQVAFKKPEKTTLEAENEVSFLSTPIKLPSKPSQIEESEARSKKRPGF